MRILAVCGSLQARSRNRELLEMTAAAAPPGVEVVIFESLGDLPHFDPDLEATGVPPAVARWRHALAGSDAVLIACPEYAFSLGGRRARPRPARPRRAAGAVSGAEHDHRGRRADRPGAGGAGADRP